MGYTSFWFQLTVLSLLPVTGATFLTGLNGYESIFNWPGFSYYYYWPSYDGTDETTG
jgi:hypothetical protein